MDTNLLQHKGLSLAAAFLIILFFGYGVGVAKSTTLDGERGIMKSERTDTITVPEMQCGMCEERIEKALRKIAGVTSVSADAEANRVIITYNSKKTSQRKIERVIAVAGYDAGSARTTTAAQAKLSGCCKPPTE